MSIAQHQGPFHRLVVLGESTVQGGGWLAAEHERWGDILARLLEVAQEVPLAYYNAGLGASVISPASPGYAASNKPSALERLHEQVIARAPELLVIAYGLNDMRAGMPVEDFRAELLNLLAQVRATLCPVVVLVNVYYLTAYHFYPPFDQGSAEATQAYNRMLAEVATTDECIYADVWSAEAGADHVVHQDTVHANKLGNMLIAHRVFEAIIRACPALASAVRRRDETTEWTTGIKEWQNACVEPSGSSRPGQ